VHHLKHRVRSFPDSSTTSRLALAYNRNFSNEFV
jgi:hypothetical protein